MIRLTIQRKVFLATFALATIMAGVLTLVMRWNLGQGFERYTTAAEFARLDWMVSNIETEYAAHGNWDFVRAAPEEVWLRLSHPNPAAGLDPAPAAPDENRPPPPWDNRPPRPDGGYPPPRPDESYPPPPLRPPPPRQGPPGNGRPLDALRIGPRLALLDNDGKRLAGNASGVAAAAEKAILYQGKAVGRLTLQAAPSSVQQLDAAFLASQTHNMLLAGLAALGCSLLAAWLLARHLLAPIRDLTAGARKVSGGALDAQIQVRSDDELGELSATFNEMAGRLARLEESRRAWISETSHELRTPLAVLRAEIEAMQDGVRTPDAATLSRLHKQVLQLSTLVDDLRLTLEREPGGADMEHALVAPIGVLEDCIASFRDRYQAAAIEIDTLHLTDAGWHVRGDTGRLTQVFGNLLENTLRYTHAGGRLSISAQADNKSLLLQFDDTAPAPPPAALPRLFERFFRAEPSRSRLLGGSGLGLAICKTLTEAHGGKIGAALSKLGGLHISIELPLEKP